MAEGKIIRLGGGAQVVIDGQEIIEGEYSESIAKFDTVFGNLIPEGPGAPQWDTSITKLANPATLPPSQAWSTAFSTDGTYLAVGHGNFPRITIYKRSGDTFTKLPDPATLPPFVVNDVSFSTDGTYLAVAHQFSPFITIYKRDGDTFTKLPDPVDLPTELGYSTTFSNDGAYLAVGHFDSPFITIYKRSGDTFTKLANPATLPTGDGHSIAFSNDGTYLAVGYNLSPYIAIYKRDGDTFTKLADPTGGLPTGRGEDVSFSTDGTYLAVAHLNSPFITIYKRSGDTFTKLANPATLPTGFAQGTSFSTDGTYLAVAHGSSPFITIYKRSGDTFTKLANPATLPPATARGTAFSEDGTYLAVAHGLSPFITIYKTTIGEPTDSFIEIVKATNILTLTENTTNAGYALEDGIAGQTKTMMSLFAQLTDQPIEFLLTTAPTGQLSSPPPVFLRVGFVNPTNQTVQVEALLFRADTPETLLGVNLLPTTLAPGESFGPSDVATAGGNSGLHTLTLRIKEAGKAFSAIVEVSVDIVDEGGGGFTFA